MMKSNVIPIVFSAISSLCFEAIAFEGQYDPNEFSVESINLNSAADLVWVAGTHARSRDILMRQFIQQRESYCNGDKDPFASATLVRSRKDDDKLSSHCWI